MTIFMVQKRRVIKFYRPLRCVEFQATHLETRVIKLDIFPRRASISLFYQLLTVHCLCEPFVPPIILSPVYGPPRDNTVVSAVYIYFTLFPYQVFPWRSDETNGEFLCGKFYVEQDVLLAQAKHLWGLGLSHNTSLWQINPKTIPVGFMESLDVLLDRKGQQKDRFSVYSIDCKR